MCWREKYKAMKTEKKPACALASGWINYFAAMVLLAWSVQGKAQILSPESKISLLTIGPGDELYSGFGHSALWVFDPRMGIDRVYNYGTFEFSPDFYMKFVRGKLDYMLSVSDLPSFMYNYQEEKRSVTEQILNLSPRQKEELFKFLEINYLPANRYYRYDFFFDNCSSRLRDALIAVCQDSLRFNMKHDLNMGPKDMIDLYLQDKKVQDLGMDIGLGAPSDKKLTPFGYMFLPDFLKAAVDSAEIKRNASWMPLVAKSVILYEGIPRSQQGGIFSPSFVIWILFILIVLLTYLQWKHANPSFLPDAIGLFLIGILGMVLVFLWFFTDHTVTVRNWDLWWANPILLPIAFLLMHKSKPPLLKFFFLLYAGVCFLLIVFWKILPEHLNIAVLPLLCIFIVRSLYISYYFKNRVNTIH